MSSDAFACPYCGYVHHSAWDYGLKSAVPDEVQCENPYCEKWFVVTMLVDVDYEARKLNNE